MPKAYTVESIIILSKMQSGTVLLRKVFKPKSSAGSDQHMDSLEWCFSSYMYEENRHVLDIPEVRVSSTTRLV